MLQQIDGKGASAQIPTYAPCVPTELDRSTDRALTADPDAALVEALKAQAPAAFDELVKQYGRRLLNVAMRITKNREDAEDAVQESFLKIFKNIDGFRACSKFATWLTRITINQALMLVRSNTQKFVSFDESTEIEGRLRSPQSATVHSTPEQLYAQHEFQDLVLDLANVRKSSRAVMDLYINQNLSEVEISHVLRLSSSAVKARLHRGRLDLREATSRRFRSMKVARACKNTFPATAQGLHPPVDVLSNGKPEPRLRFTSASGLAGDNPLTAPYSRPSCEMESCLPDHLDPQLLTQSSHSSVSRPENCF